MNALTLVDSWPAPNVAVAALRCEGVIAERGDTNRVYHWASVTKPVTALAVLVALEEGTLDLDEPAGPPEATIRHLLAHASGLPFKGDTPISEPARRRIYSNTGFVVLGEALEHASGMPVADYLRAAVLAPLGTSAELRGDTGEGVWGSLADLVAVGRELLAPTLVAPETLAEATTVAFPGLAGVLPDFGRLDPNDWGLGYELRDGKSPHWTGTRNSPRTFGHFGGSGTFLWVDPEQDVALVCLTDLPFGDWAKQAWPALSDAVLAEVAPS